MGEKKGKRKISEITNKAMKRVKRGVLTAGTILFVGGALVGTTFSNNAQSVKESVMEHFRNKQRSATTTSIDEGNKDQTLTTDESLSEKTSKKSTKPTTVSSPINPDSVAVNTLNRFDAKNVLVLGVNFPKFDGNLNLKDGSNSLSIDDKIKQTFAVKTLPSSQLTTTVKKDKSLAISFGAGSMMYVAGDNINFDVAMGVALSTKLSDHSAFFAELIAGTGIPLNKGATVSDLAHNAAFMAKVGMTFSWGGNTVTQVTPNVYLVAGAIGHNVQNKDNQGGSSSGGQDKPSEEGTIDYDTTLPNNGNDSLGTEEGDTIYVYNPADFADNNSLGFGYEQ